MRNGQTHLFIPGPTNIPEAVRQAMNVPMQDMRAPDFGDLTLPLFPGLKKVFKTDSRVFMFPGSGTGAWEAAISNTLNTGDKVLMSRFGQFSHLWVDMCERLGLDVVCIDVDWGKGVPLDEYAKVLEADKTHEIKAVFATQNETATGVTSDIAGVRQVLNALDHPALLFVDGVSSIASIDFRMDEWGIDLAVAGSQKGFMMPAGLSMLGVSEKALEAHKSGRMARCYFSFEDMLKMNDDGYFPYTPPTQLFYGLKKSLELMEEEGLENIFARHNRLAEGVRCAIAAWEGCRLCADDTKWHSDTVSAIVVPEDVDAKDVLSIGYHKYRTSFGAGLARLSGKVFRIGHLGDLNEVMCLAALGAAEISLYEAGAHIELGSGVAAAQAHFAGTAGASMKIAAE